MNQRDQPTQHTPNNVTKDIKANHKIHLHTRQANTKGINSCMWDLANSFIITTASNFLGHSTNIKKWQYSKARKARWGHIWAIKVAYIYKYPDDTNTSNPYNNMCPVCQKSKDGQNTYLVQV